MTKCPLVSVVMATYNEAPQMLADAIQSILKQTYINFEMLILDDSTHEETIAVINELAALDSRVRVIRKSSRMGFGAALNIGIHEAKGKYIARMDGDDISLPDRLAHEVAYMESHPDVAVLGGAINIIDRVGCATGERVYPKNGKILAVCRSPFAHPTVIMRKDLALNGFLYDENLRKAEDLDLWLRYIKHGYKIRNIPLKILNYRILGNLAQKRGREQYATAYQIRKTHFTFKYPLFSVLSVFFGFITSVLPMKFFEFIYKQENQSKI